MLLSEGGMRWRAEVQYEELNQGQIEPKRDLAFFATCIHVTTCWARSRQPLCKIQMQWVVEAL
jgi:hypothetical protein